MNIAEVIKSYPLPAGYYYKVDPKPFAGSKILYIKRRRWWWLDREVARRGFISEYSYYDTKFNRGLLISFLEDTIPTLHLT